MEVSVPVNDFVRQLQTAARITDKKTNMPILSTVLIETPDNGQIHLTATDLDLGIRCACTADIKKNGRFTIPARRLLDYTRLLSEPNLHIKVSAKDWASFVCGRSRTRIAGLAPESFPELPEPPSHPLATLPSGLLSRLVEQTSFAISEEESRFTLTGALLILTEAAMEMVATDAHRMALSRISHPMPGIE
jgi:DNA polymerase III subunit beta